MFSNGDEDFIGSSDRGSSDEIAGLDDNSVVGRISEGMCISKDHVAGLVLYS